MALPKRFRHLWKKRRAVRRRAVRCAWPEKLRQRRQQLGIDSAMSRRCSRSGPPTSKRSSRGVTDELPAPVYAIGFMRAYADYLGLDSEREIERLQGRSGRCADQAGSVLSDPARRPQHARRRRSCWSAMILAFCGYGPGIICPPASAPVRSASPRSRLSCNSWCRSPPCRDPRRRSGRRMTGLLLRALRALASGLYPRYGRAYR